MNMQVSKNTVVTLDYNVKDPDGVLVDAGQEPLVYMHGGFDDIFPKIEEALEGKKVGESVVVKLQPDEAFGEYDADLIQVESRKGFPKELEVGMQFEGTPESGDDDDLLIFRVAGMALVFTCTVTDVRPASEEEMAHGHVHEDGECDDA